MGSIGKNPAEPKVKNEWLPPTINDTSNIYASLIATAYIIAISTADAIADATADAYAYAYAQAYATVAAARIADGATASRAAAALSTTSLTYANRFVYTLMLFASASPYTTRAVERLSLHFSAKCKIICGTKVDTQAMVENFSPKEICDTKSLFRSLIYAVIGSPANKFALPYCDSPGGILDSRIAISLEPFIQALKNTNASVSQRKAAITLQVDEGHDSDGGGQSKSPDCTIEIPSDGDGDSGTSPTDDQSGRALAPPSDEQPPPHAPPQPPNTNASVSQRKAAITLQVDEGHDSDGGGQSKSPDCTIEFPSDGDGDSGTSPTDDQSGRALAPPSDEQPPPHAPPQPPNAPPTDGAAASLFNYSKVIKICLLMNTSVGLLSTDIRLTASKDLPVHASGLLLSAACCSTVGSGLCLAGLAMQHFLGHRTKAQKFAKGMIATGFAVTACGVLSIMGAQLPEHVNIWATLAGCAIPISAVSFLFKN